MPTRQTFDESYYARFYGLPRGRASDRRETALLGDLVCAYLRYLEQPVRRVLDVGCGLGLWKDVIGAHYPRARYLGIEQSEYLCERFGWKRGSVVDFASRGAFDLVVCKDVLQYLPDAEASAAIDNLASLCRGALYFNLLTREDWDENCDQDATNGDVYLRRSAWYLRRLRRHFVRAGGGLFVSRESQTVLWELEKLE